MNRYDYDEDDDGFYDRYDDESSDEDLDEDEQDEDVIPDASLSTGETNVDISMEIDDHGNEVWFAGDSRIPGSSSMGHSLEEAMEGVEERRRQYREMLRKSREERARREHEQDG